MTIEEIFEDLCIEKDFVEDDDVHYLDVMDINGWFNEETIAS